MVRGASASPPRSITTLSPVPQELESEGDNSPTKKSVQFQDSGTQWGETAASLPSPPSTSGAAQQLFVHAPVLEAKASKNIRKDVKVFPEWDGVYIIFFTMVSLLLLAPSLALAWQLSGNSSARYWAPACLFFAPLSLVFAIISYLWHAHIGKLARQPMMLASVPGPLLLAFIAILHLGATHNTHELLNGAAACSRRAQLNAAWLAADYLYKDCKHRNPEKERIQDCDAYSPPEPVASGNWSHFQVKGIYEFRYEWDYLQSLEVELNCAGWCFARRSMWTVFAAKDTCSNAAAFAIKYQVRPLAFKLLVTSLLGMLVSLAVIRMFTNAGLVATSSSPSDVADALLSKYYV